MYLAGDIGGTKTILGEYEPSDDGLKEVRKATFPSQDYESFDQILEEFARGRAGALQSACFGVAGTVVHGKSRLTNLPWTLDEAKLAKTAGVPRVKLLNDLESTAFGMLTLPTSEMAVLSPGRDPSPSRAGNIAVIAAGTGLGEAILYWDGRHYHPIASEGGHADFAPREDREITLWRSLRDKFGGHVSYERVLSGPGFLDIYAFLRDHEGMDEPAWLADAIREGQPNAVISEHGMSRRDPLCAETVRMFASAYGAEAGNLALRCVANGGVFLGGGIAPKMLPALRSDAFREAFLDKGRFRDYLEGVQVSVALNSLSSLLGAAAYARRLDG